MSSENVLRHQMPRRHSDSVLAETSFIKSNQPSQNNGSFSTSMAHKVRGISIDMSVVLGDVASIERHRRCISPISVASADQPVPPMRPRAPTSTTGASPMAVSSQSQSTIKLPSFNGLNISNANAFVASRRSKILANVSSRIAKIQEDTKSNSAGQPSSTNSLVSLTHDEQQNSNFQRVTNSQHGNITKSPVLNSIQECKTEESAVSSTLEGEVISDAQLSEELKIFVDEYPPDKYLSLLDLLRNNKFLHKLDIVRNRIDQGARTRRSADLDHLFHVLHFLSNSLKELCLQNLRLQDLTSVSLGVYDHVSIEHLQLTMESGTLDENTTKAIASMPRLLSIELEVRQSFPIWPLLDSKSLTILSIVSTHFAFDASDVIAMADKLETNSILQVLDLEPLVPAWCLVTLITSLRSCQDSRLETFQFSCRTEDEKDGDACMIEMIKLMKRPCSKLRVIWNYCFESFRVSDVVKDMTMSVLYICNILQQFHVFMEREEYGAIKCHVLERNMMRLQANERTTTDLSTDFCNL
jgi:hypothetical protein